MSLPETPLFDKGREGLKKYYIVLVVILVAILSFGLGRLSKQGNKEPIRVEYAEGTKELVATPLKALERGETPQNGAVSASKSGTKYHFIHCPGWKQIKEENRITFQNAKEAELAGYTLAGNCK